MPLEIRLSYKDRRVYEFDVFERSPTEAAETLRHYLVRARVENGEALQASNDILRVEQLKTQPQNTL
jgi:hypothetical protein